MPLGREFVQTRVDVLLEAAGKEATPVDLYRLAQEQRVVEIDFRPLVSGGGICPIQCGFKVTIDSPSYFSLTLEQNQRRESPTTRLVLSRRQRFTLAHELGHTLFFDISVSPPRVVKGAPKDRLLEYYCQYAARRILIPQTTLLSRIAQRRICSDLILDLAAEYRTSAQVVVLRLDDLGNKKGSDTAVIMGEFNSQFDDALILAACSGDSILSQLGKPAHYGSLRKWCGKLLDSEFWQPTRYERVVLRPTGGLGLRKIPYPGRLPQFFLELDFY